MLGSAGIIVMDETTCMVWAAQNLLHFYKHESCGKCTPCREGGDWLHKLLSKIDRGEGEMRDLDLLLSVSNNIVGKTLCAFGDAAATPALTTLKHVPRRVRGAHPRRPLHGAGRLARPRQAARMSARGDAMRARDQIDACDVSISTRDHRAARADLRRLPVLRAVGGLHGLDGAQGLRLHPGSRRAEPGRPRRVCCSRSPTSSSCSSRRSCGRRPPTRCCSSLAPIISAAAAFAAFSVVPFGAETTLFGLLDRADSAGGDRRQRRRAGHLRDHLDGRLRHRARRLELQQQVLAARRPALVGADDQLRAVLRPVARGGHHAGRLAVAARDRR